MRRELETKRSSDTFALSSYTLRYVLYCKAHGWKKPEDIPPNVKGYDFVRWMGARWREWDKETNHKGSYTPDDHDAFDAWLTEKVGG